VSRVQYIRDTYRLEVRGPGIVIARGTPEDLDRPFVPRARLDAMMRFEVVIDATEAE
jgi:hypothetical protein